MKRENQGEHRSALPLGLGKNSGQVRYSWILSVICVLESFSCSLLVFLWKILLLTTLSTSGIYLSGVLGHFVPFTFLYGTGSLTQNFPHPTELSSPDVSLAFNCRVYRCIMQVAEISEAKRLVVLMTSLSVVHSWVPAMPAHRYGPPVWWM